MGGLTAALLLRDQGHDVTVYERSSEELQQRGAGIGFLPDSSRYLVERAGRSLDQLATVTHGIRYLDRHERVVDEVPCTYHFSSWNTVYRNLLAEFGRDRYLLGCEVVGCDELDEGVAVRFADGSSVRADLLVAADGVGSTFRQQLMPDVQHQYAETAPGERSMNFVWYRNYLDGGDLTDLMTDREGTVREVSLPPGTVDGVHVAEMRSHAAARLPAAVAAVVCGAAEPFVQVVYDLDIPSMVDGRACLLGDAAFLGRPHAAAGTAKAADDAWALGTALSRHRDVEDALRDYESSQVTVGRGLIERTERIGRRSQTDNSWVPGDPDLIFGLRGPGT